MKVYQLMSLLESQPANVEVLIELASDEGENNFKAITRVELASEGDSSCILQIED